MDVNRFMIQIIYVGKRGRELRMFGKVVAHQRVQEEISD
jgi:hypothetical protein